METYPVHPVTLLQSLINCPSITPTDAGAQKLLIETLKPFGFSYIEKRFKEENTAAVDNVLLTHGNQGSHFCFAGHTDVVPPGDLEDWSYDPFAAHIEEGILYGRGAVDMKGAIACYISALTRFVSEYKDHQSTLSLLITGDEEGPAINGTTKMLDYLNTQQIQFDGCIVGEPTNPDKLGEMIKIGRRGSSNFTLIIIGKQGHVAYPELALNPIPHLLTLLLELQHFPLDEGSKHFPPSHFEITTVDIANNTSNIIPQSATAKFNIRFNDHYTAETLDAVIRRRCTEYCKTHGLSFELHSQSSAESFLSNPGNLSEQLSKAITIVTGISPQLSTTGGTSDARFIQAYCPTVEFGLINQTAHKVDECVAIKDLELLTQIYYQFLLNTAQ